MKEYIPRRITDRRSGLERRSGPIMQTRASSGVLAFLAGFCAALLLFFAPRVFAVEREAVFRWVGPTTSTDGSPLAEGDLIEYRLYLDSAPGQQIVERMGPGESEWRGVLDLDPGIYCFHMTAVATGGESDPSNQVCRVWDVEGDGTVPVSVLVIPSPPAGFEVELI